MELDRRGAYYTRRGLVVRPSPIEVVLSTAVMAASAGMAVSEAFLTYVIEQLANVRRVTSRRMFGGVGLYSDDVFFAVIDNDTVFFKVNDATRPRYVRRRLPPFAPIPGKPPMLGYYQVPPEVLEDFDALTAWAREAVGVGASTPAKATRRPKAGPRAARLDPIRALRHE